MTGTAPAAGRRLVVPALVGVTAIWGSTFVVVKDAIREMPLLDFLAWRFGLAALVMVVLRPRAVAALGPTGRRRGAWLGVALGAGYVFQTAGLLTVRASVSGFITGMFVVFTPLCAALLFRRRVAVTAWAGVALATAGLALLSLRGSTGGQGELLTVGQGELLTLGCAVAFALHIVGLGEWSAAHDAYGLAVVQLLVVAAGCAVAGAPVGMPPDGGVWAALALTAVLATAVAFLVQTWAQAHLPPTRAAVIMTMEPVFAGLFGVVVAGEALGGREIAGSLLILVAMLAVEIGPRHGAEGDVARLEA